MIPVLEAQVTADEQSDSAAIPINAKTFTCNGKVVDMLSFIQRNPLSPDEIEILCNIEPGEHHPLWLNAALHLFERID